MRRSILAAMTAMLLLGAAPMVFAKDLHGVALVIGESDYDSDQLRDLTNPKNDARAMGDLLDGIGFQVDQIRDKGHDKLEQSIADFVDEAKGADVALVYYSGHGIEAGGEDYLVPTDADISSPAKAGESLVPLKQLLDELAKTVPVTIVLLDACRTDAFPAGTTIQLPGTSSTIDVATTGLGEVRGPVPVAQGGNDPNSLGMVIGFAAAPGQAALDGDAGGNSPYAAALLKHLGAGGYSFGDVMTMVSEEVYLKTDARQLPWTNSSLRRVLSFGVAPAVGNPDEAAIADGRRKLLLSIAALPDGDRKQVETAAQQGAVPMDALYGLLAALGQDVPRDPAALDKLLTDQTARLKQIMTEQNALSSTDPEIVRLSGLAQKALSEGALDANVKFWEAAKARYLKISATLDETEANLKARRLEGGDVLARTAEAHLLTADYQVAAENYAQAYEQVKRWDDSLALRYKWAEAGALENQGDLRGDNAALSASIDAYNAALQLAPRDTQPDEWAGLNSDLAIALSAMARRTGNASMLQQSADAVRASLNALSLADEPLAWANAQNILGTILSDSGDNLHNVGSLMEAIAAFDAALQVQTRAAMPVQWAMVETNLGTAYVRLARYTSDPSGFQKGIDAYRAAIEVETRAANPAGWADNQVNLGSALQALGVVRNDNGLLRQAVAAFKAALEERPRATVPLDWAEAQLGLAYALNLVGVRAQDGDSLVEAEAAYRAALAEFRPDRDPQSWATAQSDLGILLYRRSISSNATDMTEAGAAADAFSAALTVWTEQAAPAEWAADENSLATTYSVLGRLDDALAAYRATQRVYTKQASLQNWAMAENNAGWMTAQIGYRDKNRLQMLDGKKSVQTARHIYEQLALAIDPNLFDVRIQNIDSALALLDGARAPGGG